MCVNSKEDDPVTNDGGEIGNTRKRGSEECVEWVCCPVCAVSVRGDDFTVNSHIGMFGFFRATLPNISRDSDLPLNQKS